MVDDSTFPQKDALCVGHDEFGCVIADDVTRRLIIGKRNAYEFLTKASEQELANAFFLYGADRHAAKIAREVVSRREAGVLPKTTVHFVGMINGLMYEPPKRARRWWEFWK